jgi:methionyl-tRNA formyltransferase
MEPSLSILLFAHGRPGALALRELRAAGHRVVGCVTHLRHDHWDSSLPAECKRLGVACWTDPTTVDGQLVSMANRPDLVLSVGYRGRIEMPYLGLGRIGAFNVAGSQLPRYRGCFPFRWALLNGETTWGVTVHQMTGRYCDGAVLHRKPLVVRQDENAFDFYGRWSEALATAGLEAVRKLASGVYGLCSLDVPSPLLFGPALPHGGAIDWNQPAARIDAFVRALDFGRDGKSAYEHLTPPATARIHGHDLGIWRAHFGGTMSVYPPGTITRCDQQVWVQCARGHLAIESICVGGRDYDAAQYFEELGLGAGDEFDTSHAWSTPGKVHRTFREVSHAA